MRIAVLGAGRIGRQHCRTLAAQPDISGLVIADPDEASARAAAEEVGGTVARTAEEALDAVDAAAIAASTNEHARLVRLAVDRALPVFCEKPRAFDLDETIDVVRAVEQAGAIVQVGFQRRFDRGFRAAHDLIASGDLGTVYLVRLIAHDHEPPPDAYIPVSGGLFRDSSIHDFDALRWVTGHEVDEVYAAGSVRGFPVFAAHDDVDTGAAILRLDDGTLAVLGQTRHDPRGYDIRMEVVGSRDAVVVGLDEHTPLRSVEAGATAPGGPEWTTFLTRFEAAYVAELAAFVDVAAGRVPTPCSARDALQAMRISVAATLSRHEHRPVALAEVADAPSS